VVNNFQHLPFDDSPDAIEVGAALVFEVVGSGGFAPQPKYHQCSREDGETGRRKQIIPVA
jgi:hypothetical protein